MLGGRDFERTACFSEPREGRQQAGIEQAPACNFQTAKIINKYLVDVSGFLLAPLTALATCPLVSTPHSWCDPSSAGAARQHVPSGLGSLLMRGTFYPEAGLGHEDDDRALSLPGTRHKLL